jgi:hypothetical protein
MATATIPDTRTTPPAIIEYDISALEQRVTDAWAAYQQKAEPLGIDFGKACSELREKGEVVQGGTTFSRRLLELSIPRSTACWWIDRYETLIGVKEPKPFVESPVEPAPESVEVDSDTNPEPNDPPVLQQTRPDAQTRSGTGGRESFLRAVVLGAASPYEFGRTATAGK